MNKLTSKNLKEFASRISGGGGGVNIIGVANVERFNNAPERMHPKNIFPDCRSVISIVQPIPRSTYRGITEGTYWPNYTYYSYNRLNSLFRPMITYDIARVIEDFGFEAVPVFPGVPEHYPKEPKPLAPGRPVPDVQINVRIAAMACGLGEIGWSKVFIHPVYGPRVRIGTILTDAELEPDPLIKPQTLCKRCMKCVKDCPGNAIPRPGERPSIKIRIDDVEYEWADVHMGRCAATHHGLNWKCSPFFKRYFPGLDLNICSSTICEALGYKLAITLANGVWDRGYPEFPGKYTNPYLKQIIAHGGYYAICGARGCIRACMEFQEKTKNIEQNNFKTPVFPDPKWELESPDKDVTGGVSEGRLLIDKYQTPDTKAGKWR